MPDVFLSYSREDQAIARRFAEGLQREGFSVWWDQSLSAGEHYDKVTEQALRTARAVVVLWSKHSVDSRWVRAEATVGDRNGTLVPAMIGACDRPVMFELTQTAELAHWDGDVEDPAWQSFVAGVRRNVSGEVPAPAEQRRQPLPQRPGAKALVRDRTGRRRPWVAIAIVGLVFAFTNRDKWDWPWKQEMQAAGAPAQAAGTAAPVASVMLAVLPFKDISPGQDQRAFVDGLTVEIRGALERLSGMTVIGRASSDFYRDKGIDLRQVGRDLGVAQIVEGEVRRSGDRLIVNVRLNDAATGGSRWAEYYERPLADIWEIQQDIARKVANALQVKLGVGEIGSQPGMTRNLDAYAVYLEGVAEDDPLNPEVLSTGIAKLERAVGIDPSFATAWAGLANYYSFAQSRRLPGATQQEWGRKVDDAWVQVRHLVPDAPILTRPPAENPMFLLTAGRIRESLSLWKRGVAANPRGPFASSNLAAAYLSDGQLQAAAAEAKRGLEFAGNNGFVSFSAWTVALAGKDRAFLSRAIDAFDSSDLSPRIKPLLDQPREAMALVRGWDSASGAVGERGLERVLWMAWFGAHDEALQLLLGEIVPQLNTVRRSPLWLLWHPLLKEVRSKPGFKDVPRRLKMKDNASELTMLEAWRRYGWGDFCKPIEGTDDFECH